MNLKRIKDLSIEWSLKKKAQDIKDLVDIEFELKRYYDRVSFVFTLVEDKLILVELESHKRIILCFKEKGARQKSRALWLICGDDNTPFFHKFAAHRKNINTIWKIQNDFGSFVEGAEDIAFAGIQHFDNLFREEVDLHLPKIVHSAGFFPLSVSEDDNAELMNPVLLQDIKHILSISKNDKSPGPNGIPVEVYRCLFDVLG